MPATKLPRSSQYREMVFLDPAPDTQKVQYFIFPPEVQMEWGLDPTTARMECFRIAEKLSERSCPLLVPGVSL